jgi:hypothetical protein
LIVKHHKLGQTYFKIFDEYLIVEAGNDADEYTTAVYQKMLTRALHEFWNTYLPPDASRQFPNRKYIATRYIIDATKKNIKGTQDVLYQGYNNNRAQESLAIVRSRIRKGEETDLSLPIRQQLYSNDMSNKILQSAKNF